MNVGVYIEHLDRSIPAAAYVAGYRHAKAHPGARYRYGLTTWWPVTGAEIVEQYRRDMHERIDRRGGLPDRTSRVPLAEWGIVAIPRAVLEPSTVRTMNRHQRARLGHRARTAD